MNGNEGRVFDRRAAKGVTNVDAYAGERRRCDGCRSNKGGRCAATKGTPEAVKVIECPEGREAPSV